MVKVSEAPQAGWYPDPQGGVRLRWWDGSDWSDRYRSRPATWTGHLYSELMQEDPAIDVEPFVRQRGRRPADTAEIVAQVRKATREEVDRAADVFSARARAAAKEIPPLISQYTSRFFRWVKIILVVTVVIAAAFIIFNAVAQVSFFEWLGDRIDNLGRD